MNTLIVPCAGKSSRFPNMKPKWMLTHPDGELMIEKSIKGLNLDIFDRIIITIVKPHDEKYEAALVLSQVFKDEPKVEICILDDFTKSASETICLTLDKMNVTGRFIIKDSDNYVKLEIEKDFGNFIACCDLHKHPSVTNVPAKSFVVCNEQGIIEDIVEKRIVSNVICVGVYAFEDASIFKSGYLDLLGKNISGELYVSHVVSYLLGSRKYVFCSKEVQDYADWGTLEEWRKVQDAFKTYFVDVDGVLMKNRGKYGSSNWYNNREIIPENLEIIRKLQSKGAQIIIVTSRTEEFREDLQNILTENGINPYAILMGINHSARVVINDFAPTNPYPSAIAITLPRNNFLKEYLD